VFVSVWATPGGRVREVGKHEWDTYFVAKIEASSFRCYDIVSGEKGGLDKVAAINLLIPYAVEAHTVHDLDFRRKRSVRRAQPVIHVLYFPGKLSVLCAQPGDDAAEVICELCVIYVEAALSSPYLRFPSCTQEDASPAIVLP
jgi:hypothetical protein